MTYDPEIPSTLEKTLEKRAAEISRLFSSDCEAATRALDNFTRKFHYIPAHTFENQTAGCFQCEIRRGLRFEAFRFFIDEKKNCYLIEFWSYGWLRTACCWAFGENEVALLDLWHWFEISGAVTNALVEVGRG